MPNKRIWTVLDILKWTTAHFESREIPNARRQAEEIIAHALGISRIEVYVQFEKPLELKERQYIASMIERRINKEPLQHIFGTAPFRHLELEVSPDVLIPRPETEMLVELTLKELQSLTEEGVDHPVILDLCTGSGAIALSIASEFEDAEVHASDISKEALAVARKNAENLKLEERCNFYEGDLLIPKDIPFDLIVSNPPYVPSARIETLDVEVKDFEPVLALDGGEDGLDVFKRIISRLKESFKPPSTLPICILELDEENVEKACEIIQAEGLFSKTVVKPDLTGRNRFLVCKDGR